MVDDRICYLRRSVARQVSAWLVAVLAAAAAAGAADAILSR